MNAAVDIEDFLAESRTRIDGFLEKALPPGGEPPGLLHEAMRYAVFSGGKRLRPALAFATARVQGADPDTALPVAAATELVHAYSLVHDDLPAMDDDDERRGKPTVHVRYGESTAILVGDALLAEAFAQLAVADVPDELVRRLAQTAGSRALVGGQVDDLGFQRESATVESITSIHRRKTAALFGFAIWGSARLLSANETRLMAFDRFGLHYGLAFQLLDDVLDDDRSECSMLVVLEQQAIRERIDAELAQALAALKGFGDEADLLRALAVAIPGRLT